ENVGWGEIHIPEDQMHTAACWLEVPDAVAARFRPDELQSALVGTAHLLESLAPVFLMCDPKDLRATVEMRAPQTQRPTIYLYDAYPGGIGLAEKAYDLCGTLFQACLEQTARCGCEDGCPACVGPDAGGREPTVRLLQAALAALGQEAPPNPAPLLNGAAGGSSPAKGSGQRESA